MQVEGDWVAPQNICTLRWLQRIFYAFLGVHTKLLDLLNGFANQPDGGGRGATPTKCTLQCRQRFFNAFLRVSNNLLDLFYHCSRLWKHHTNHNHINHNAIVTNLVADNEES